MTTHECTRCQTEFAFRSAHTKIERRDFIDLPRPSKIEYLCTACWRAYIDDFLGLEQERLLPPEH